MNAATFYSRALVLPVLVILCSVPIGGKSSLFANLEQWQYCLAILGAPYMLALIGHTETLRWGSEAEIRKISCHLPLWTALVQIILSVIVTVFGTGFLASAYLWGIAAGAMTVVLGYCYVLLINITLRFLRSVNWIVAGEGRGQ